MVFEVSEDFKKQWQGEPTFDELMALEGEMYRQVERRKTFKFIVNNKEYFAKIHRGVGWYEVLKNLLQLRWPVLGASNEVVAIKKLESMGVKTMRLVAYGQRGYNPAELESFVITESLEPALSLEDVSETWLKTPPSVALKRFLINKVAEITRALHQQGVNHRDLYICHFLWQNKNISTTINAEGLELFLIDLHRVQIRSSVPFRWQVKDLAALYFSSMHIGLTQRDFLYFVRAYSGKNLRECLGVDAALWKKVEIRAKQLDAKPVKD
jgi:heptose I phosphotransferase